MSTDRPDEKPGSAKPRAKREVLYSERSVAYYPRAKHPALLVIGEAPGPRGADRTGYPFWGDDSGRDIYGLIASLGLLQEPFEPWKRRTNLSGTSPPAGDYTITNACPQMPLGPGGTFTSPEPGRLQREAGRLAQEIQELGPGAVLACGKAAAFALARAGALLGAPPPPPLATGMGALQLMVAMEELLDHRWRLGAAAAFVTCHPSRNQWSPKTQTGVLHRRVVLALRQIVSGPNKMVHPAAAHAERPSDASSKI